MNISNDIPHFIMRYLRNIHAKSRNTYLSLAGPSLGNLDLPSLGPKLNYGWYLPLAGSLSAPV